MKKRIMLISLLLTFGIGGETVSADTLGYVWEFSNTSSTYSLAKGKKDDTEQRYYLTIGGNLTSSNIFGTRIRRASDGASVSSYVLHTHPESSVAYSYSSHVSMNVKYYMRGKKDSDSTYSGNLYTEGRTTY